MIQVGILRGFLAPPGIILPVVIAGSSVPHINAILTEDANTPPTGPNDPITTEAGDRLITEDS